MRYFREDRSPRAKGRDGQLLGRRSLEEEESMEVPVLQEDEEVMEDEEEQGDAEMDEDEGNGEEDIMLLSVTPVEEVRDK